MDRPQTRPATPIAPSAHPVALSGAGTIIHSGTILDLDPNDKVNGRRWYGEPWTLGEAQKMDRDGHVRKARDTIANPLLSADWAIEPAAKTPLDVEVADFCSWQLFTLNSFRAALKNLLTYLRDGFSLLELTTDVIPIPRDRFPVHPGNGHAYAVTGFHSIPAWSVDRFIAHPDAPRTLKEIHQTVSGADAEKSHTAIIPASHLLRATWEQDGANFAGFAPQRSCWGDWHVKTLLKTIDAMAHERHHLGIPIAHLESELSDADKTILKSTLRNLRAHEHGYAIFPNGVKFEWSTVNGTQLTNIAEAIWRCDFAIAHTFGAGFMLLGAKGVGSYNLADTQSGQHNLDIKAHAAFVADVFNSGLDGWSLIERIVRANYGPDVKVPRLRARNLPTEAFDRILPLVHNLTVSGHITPDEPTEDHLRRVLTLPPSDPSTRRSLPAAGATATEPPAKESAA